VGEFRIEMRRELVFLALGTMDVCIITPLLAALVSRIIPTRPLPVAILFLVTVLAVHYLARLVLWLPLSPGLRPAILGLAMLVSGLLVIHQLLHAQMRLLEFVWLAGIFRSLRQPDMAYEAISKDLSTFLLVLFLWWRGLVLAQRRISGDSVAFRFRLGLVMLAATTLVGGFILPWPVTGFVFLFFFASLLGIALARAEDVGQQYGGSHSPFGLGWLTTLVVVCLAVLLVAAGVAALLTGENVSLVLKPVLDVLRFILLALVYVTGWIVFILVTPLSLILGEIRLEELRRTLAGLGPWGPLPRSEPSAVFTPEQLALARTVGIVGGVLLLVAVVAFSLRRLRARAGRRRAEDRESVWDRPHLRRGLRNLLRHGRRRMDDATTALSRSLLGRLLAARTIRRIYAHMTALAAELGYPRPDYQTPYEYLPTLGQAFPQSRDAVADITEAYVAVHYGEVPERPEDLAGVRASWESIQEAAKRGA